MSIQTLNRATQSTTTPTVTTAAASARPVGDAGTLLSLRLLAVASLAAAAYIHLALAFAGDLTAAPVTMGQMFVGQAVATIAVAALLLFRDHNLIWLMAVAIGIGSAIPILASVYMPLPAIGMFPPINEPMWYPEKVFSLAAELAVPALWLIRRIAPPAAR